MTDSTTTPPQPPATGTASTVLEATTKLLAPLLNTLDSLQFAGRHLHPPVLDTLAQHLEPLLQPLADATDEFATVDWPEHLAEFSARLSGSAASAHKGVEGLVAARSAENPVMAAYRSLRHATAARSELYPLAQVLPPLSRFFVDPEAREDAAVLARIESSISALATAGDDDPVKPPVGVMHLQNERDARGGCSLYIPEYYHGEPMPLVVALHGGSGHGADFLWTWLVAARSAGAIVLSPTSTGATWSIQEPDIDHAHLTKLVSRVAEQWSVDSERILLTGMSDGGTFSLLSGLQSDSFATHLAPVSGTFHPFLMQVAEPGRIKNLPVYLVHGALDWMFPVDTAQLAYTTLKNAGVDIHYSEIDDLSHTYPVEENWKILQWLKGNELKSNG